MLAGADGQCVLMYVLHSRLYGRMSYPGAHQGNLGQQQVGEEGLQVHPYPLIGMLDRGLVTWAWLLG